MTFLRSHFSRLLLPIALAVLGVGLCGWLVPGEMAAVQEQLTGFPDSDVPSHVARTSVLAGLCFLPALAGFFYAIGGTLDRYIARQFAGIFCICLTALIMIWLLLDLGDKLGDMKDSKHLFQTISTFYATRAPAILLLLLPYSLLLALLYSLGKLSNSREVIAMIQAGRSVGRIARPLILAGLIFSLLSLGLNYQWAPVAEGRTEEILQRAIGKPAMQATHVLYRNPTERRLWQIGGFPADYEKGKPLQDLEITTTSPNQALESRIFAKEATWDHTSHLWTFDGAIVEKFPPGQSPTFEKHPTPLVISGWHETPWLLIKPSLSADFLGIPDLTTWLRANAQEQGPFADPAPFLTQWHYRWALPFACMVTVLLATPLGIHFSRRGPGGGIIMAVILSALLLLITSITLALGASGKLSPATAAWLPNAAFALLGLYFFRRRITGKPIYLLLARFLPGNS